LILKNCGIRLRDSETTMPTKIGELPIEILARVLEFANEGATPPHRLHRLAEFCEVGRDFCEATMNWVPEYRDGPQTLVIWWRRCMLNELMSDQVRPRFCTLKKHHIAYPHQNLREVEYNCYFMKFGQKLIWHSWSSPSRWRRVVYDAATHRTSHEQHSMFRGQPNLVDVYFENLETSRTLRHSMSLSMDGQLVSGNRRAFQQLLADFGSGP
jgi:hypothetical protein